MRRTLALTILALLALGFASQLQAQVRIQCWRCSSFDTYGHYKCNNHTVPVEWDAPAYSDNGLPPPYPTQCPDPSCQLWTDAEFCWDPDCTKANPFWP